MLIDVNERGAWLDPAAEQRLAPEVEGVVVVVHDDRRHAAPRRPDEVGEARACVKDAVLVDVFEHHAFAGPHVVQRALDERRNPQRRPRAAPSEGKRVVPDGAFELKRLGIVARHELENTGTAFMSVTRLVVFDLDGTLVNSRADLVSSANEMLAVFGAAPLTDAALASFVGDGARMLVARAIAASGVPAERLGAALEKFLEIYNGRLVETTRPYEGIPELVTGASSLGAELAVITNKPEAPSLAILSHFNLASAFRWVVGGDSRFPRKPDPASLNWVMAEAGMDAAHTLFVGDSQVDADTARAAGARFCLAAYGFGQARGSIEIRPGEFSADSAREILRAIEALA
ncbi:MAG: HAD family hydrolase [Acidobacteria bacterium]|nr:MAG: HAD family hydrolase [Acidobacteriota bacterium]